MTVPNAMESTLWLDASAIIGIEGTKVSWKSEWLPNILDITLEGYGPQIRTDFGMLDGRVCRRFVIHRNLSFSDGRSMNTDNVFVWHH